MFSKTAIPAVDAGGMKSLRLSSIELVAHRSRNAVDAMRKLVRKQFSGTIGDYVAMEVDEYRTLVSETQEALNEMGSVRAICDEILPDLREYLHEERFLIQTNLYLRATRPLVSQEAEAIGWHRESFYGANMERSVNIWTPVYGVTLDNALRFIPGSQTIPDENIVVESVEDETTKRFSAGHKIGFLYAPKKIVDGIDLSDSEPMPVPDYHSGVFAGDLIHGAARNRGDEIRFSVDFRILPMKAWNPELSKKTHFASGKSYFEEY